MTPTYPPDVLARLQASGERAERTRRQGIATATRCAWCGEPMTAGTMCCGEEPWRQAA